MSDWMRLWGWTGMLCGLTMVSAHAQGVPSVMDTSRAGMETISKALGVSCDYCHQAQKADGQPDYGAPSAQKATARYMQIHLVDAFVLPDGSPLTCATCHRGRATFLPRDTMQTLPSELAGMPRAEIVDLMKSMQAQLGVQTCEACHTRGRNGRINPLEATPNKVTARYMMDHFAGSLLRRRNGKPATCASCHQGKAKFLPRRE